MTRQADPRARLVRHTVLAGIALLLALRILAAPGLAAAPAPGLIPICAGGQILWLAPGGGAPFGEPEATPTDPCPWAMIAHVLPAPERAALSVPQPIRPLPLPARRTQAASPVPRLYSPRGPPAYGC